MLLDELNQGEPLEAVGTALVIAPQKAIAPTILYLHIGEFVTTNPDGEDITTRFTIRDLPDGQFQVWYDLSKVVRGERVPIFGREMCVKNSLSLAQKAVSEHAEAAFASDRSARIQYANLHNTPAAEGK